MTPLSKKLFFVDKEEVEYNLKSENHPSDLLLQNDDSEADIGQNYDHEKNLDGEIIVGPH